MTRGKGRGGGDGVLGQQRGWVGGFVTIPDVCREEGHDMEALGHMEAMQSMHGHSMEVFTGMEPKDPSTGGTPPPSVSLGASMKIRNSDHHFN